MMRLVFVIVAVVVCLASSPIRAQVYYSGPWDPAADAAAEKAVARLGRSRGLEIRGSVLTIPALLNHRTERISAAVLSLPPASTA